MKPYDATRSKSRNATILTVIPAEDPKGMQFLK